MCMFFTIATHLRPSCYTTDPKTRWEYCDCSTCGTVTQTIDFVYDKFDSAANRIPSLGKRLRDVILSDIYTMSDFYEHNL